MTKKDKKSAKDKKSPNLSKSNAATSERSSSPKGYLGAASMNQPRPPRNLLAPVFVPNKFTNGMNSYSETVRTGPAALRPSLSKINLVTERKRLEALEEIESELTKLVGFEEMKPRETSHRPSRPSPPSVTLPRLDKQTSAFPREELRPMKNSSSYLPDIIKRKAAPELVISEKTIPVGAPPPIFPAHQGLLPINTKSQTLTTQPTASGRDTTNVGQPVKIPAPPSAPKPLNLDASACVRRRKIKIRTRNDTEKKTSH